MITITQDATTQDGTTVARARIGLIDPATYRISLHLMADLVIGTITFALMVTLLSLAAGLMITLAGIPILVATLLVARGIGEFKRRCAHAVLGVEAAAPVHTSRGVRDRLRDRADWHAVVYAALLFPVGVFTGTITLAGWATAAAAITSPFYVGWIDSVPRVAGISLDDPIAVVGTVLGGLILLLVMPAVVRTLARLDAILVQRLLT
jgi:uncharacterized membrane protein